MSYLSDCCRFSGIDVSLKSLSTLTGYSFLVLFLLVYMSCARQIFFSFLTVSVAAEIATAATGGLTAYSCCIAASVSASTAIESFNLQQAVKRRRSV
jgi:hypothetical protein